MGDIERYIVEFLCYGDTEAAKRVQLSGPVDWTLRYPHLGEKAKGQAGEKVMWREGDKAIVSPELIYLVFFYISRAEELLNQQRDQHGRFLAKYSILGEGERLSTPIVDMYAQELMKTLDLPLPPKEIAHICLTHDIDTLENYRHLRGAIGGVVRGQWKKVVASWKDLHNDPAYTFPWLIEQDAACSKHNAQCDVFYFVKHTPGKGLDYPQYNLRGKDYRATEKLLLDSGAQIGVHSSAYANNPISSAKTHRSHYLSCSIERMQQLAEAGIKDDYTMGFADKAGFRLQTCRPVRWINPKTMELSNLVLHPLTIMDCTLSSSDYMNLSENEAFIAAEKLIDKVRQHHGEVCLLWHNSNFGEETYHASLYPKILQLL